MGLSGRRRSGSSRHGVRAVAVGQVIGGLAAAGLAVGVAPAGHAAAMPVAAAIGTKSFDKGFSRSWLVKNAEVNRCVKIRVSGRFKGTRTTFRHGSGIGVRWTNVRVVHPRVRVDSLERSVVPQTGEVACGAPANMGAFYVDQKWKNDGCVVAIDSVSVSTSPWFIDAAFSCSGDQDVAVRNRSKGSGQFVDQANSDTVIRFNRYESGAQVPFKAKFRVSVEFSRNFGGGTHTDSASRTATISLPATG